tara:strand:- start:448 stop:651 length:204 start_codon:yes stop_codon:yes gene_type:complete
MALEVTTTHEYYMKDASMYYCEDHGTLLIIDDDMNKLDIGGVKLPALKELLDKVDGLKKKTTKKVAA